MMMWVKKDFTERSDLPLGVGRTVTYLTFVKDILEYSCTGCNSVSLNLMTVDKQHDRYKLQSCRAVTRDGGACNTTQGV